MGAALKNTYIASVVQINPAVIFGYPVGCIAAWPKNLTGTPALPPEWVECNGQVISDAASPYDGVTLPDLNTTNRFLRGNATSGGTGGADSHNHQYTHGAVPMTTWQSDGSTSLNVNEASLGSSGTQAVVNYAVGDYYTKNTTALPTYYQIVWIIRIK